MGNKESRNNANQTSKSFGTSKNCEKFQHGQREKKKN